MILIMYMHVAACPQHDRPISRRSTLLLDDDERNVAVRM